ncbi:MAG TPA: LPXTG cell wall anchor domain-containing protein [Actinomycetales bacterium]|nr:LPXTG cell wall anchor domain-containing protein [Actinomycetales bacterium]
MRETAHSFATPHDVGRRRRRASARARRAAVLAVALVALAPAGAYAQEAPGLPEPLRPVTDQLQPLLQPIPVPAAPSQGEAEPSPLPPLSVAPPELPVGTSTDQTSETSDEPFGDQQAGGQPTTAATQEQQTAAAGKEVEPQQEPAVAVAADGGDVGSLCLQLPGTGGSATNADVVLLGESVVQQLRDEAPELAALLGPCPEGTTAGPGLSLDVVVPGVGDVCVRVDPDGAAGPLAATVSLLGHDLLAELAAAGLPVADLVVPCEPKQNQDVDDDTQQSSPPPANVGAGQDRVDDDTQASRKPAADRLDRLPYTGSPVGALVAAGAACVAGGGALLRRFRSH